MFELLFCAGMALAPAASPYADDSLDGFLALANDRIIDGVPYTDGDGVLSGGLLYAHPGGAFASTRLAAFRGSGELLPDENLLTLETALGWRLREVAGGDLSVALLDYRLHDERARDEDIRDHQGVALTYHRGDLAFELGRELSRPYFYGAYGTFREYDVTRATVSWTPRLDDDLDAFLAVGRQAFSRSGHDYTFFTAGLRGRWRTLEWQVALVHSGDAVETLGGPDDPGVHAMARLAWPFRIL